MSATFTKDGCDREVMAWRAWVGKGRQGEPVREILIEAVGRSFGAVEAVPVCHELEFLGDSDGAYIATEMRALARLDLRDVLAQLPPAFEHINEVLPHSSLKMRVPCSSGGN